MSDREIRRALDRLDHEDVVDVFARTPECQPSPPRSRRPRRRRASPRELVLALVAVVATPVVVFFAAPTLLPERALDVVGLGRSEHYAFLDHQADGTSPVGWSPCRPVDVVVNPVDGPSDAVSLVRRALSEIQQASGITLRYAGSTGATYDSPPSSGVLVSWTTPERDHGLAGSVVGLGRSSPEVDGVGRLVYVRGEATLDGPAFARMSRADRRSVVEHELGHVMGLDHVQDRTQVMYPSTTGRSGYGAGDTAGLAKLGALPCD